MSPSRSCCLSQSGLRSGPPDDPYHDGARAPLIVDHGHARLADGVGFPLRAVERDSRATVGTDRDPFVTALGVESRPGAVEFDGEPIAAFDGAPIRTVDATSDPSPAPSVGPASVALTGAAETVDRDAVTRAIEVDPAAADGDGRDRGPST